MSSANVHKRLFIKALLFSSWALWFTEYYKIQYNIYKWIRVELSTGRQMKPLWKIWKRTLQVEDKKLKAYHTEKGFPPYHRVLLSVNRSPICNKQSRWVVANIFKWYSERKSIGLMSRKRKVTGYRQKFIQSYKP